MTAGAVGRESTPDVWSVSQVTRLVKNAVETGVGRVWIAGEISNWRVSPAGHAYFTLKDDQSQIAAVMFRGNMTRTRFEPENGLEVLVFGLVTVYEQRGVYQVICEEMQPRGMGALQLAFEKLKAKLQAEGLFDEALKKPLPLLPRRIGIVTSPTGAAIRDVLNVIQRRYAHVHILLYPVRVQGDGAAAEVAEGIRRLDAYGVDVMIIGRGGGSLEDLWAFNEEFVVRAVHAAVTPIISAVGHEIDFSLCDFAADVRAPTPSAAAELVVREYEALCEALVVLEKRLKQAATRQVEYRRARVETLSCSYVFRRPEELVRQRRQRCDELRMCLERSVSAQALHARHRLNHARRSVALLSPAHQLRRAHQSLAGLQGRLVQCGRGVAQPGRNRLATLAAQLDALSPLAILGRGYAIAWKQPENTLVRDAGELQERNKLRLRFGKGSADVTVDKTHQD